MAMRGRAVSDRLLRVSPPKNGRGGSLDLARGRRGPKRSWGMVVGSCRDPGVESDRSRVTNLGWVKGPDGPRRADGRGKLCRRQHTPRSVHSLYGRSGAGDLGADGYFRGEHILKVFQHWGSRSPCLLPFGAMRLLADDHNTILLHVRGWLAEGVLSHRISPISSLLRGGAVLRTIDDATDDRPIEFAKARISRLLQEANSNFGTAQAQSDTGRKSQCIPKILASVVG